MTTTATSTVKAMASSIPPPSLFNIQYPNCKAGMFSLREPFKDMHTEHFKTRELRTAPVPPTDPKVNEVLPTKIETVQSMPAPPRPASKRNAEVQCSLLIPNVRSDIAVQTRIDRPRKVIDYGDDEDIIDELPQYRRHRKRQPAEPMEAVYEIWEVESPTIPLRTMALNETRHRRDPRARPMRVRRPIIDYGNEDDEEEVDYDEERIIYARRPHRTLKKKTYLPPNVRMICARDDANRIFN